MELKLELDEIKRYMNDGSVILDEQVEAKVFYYINWLKEHANTKYTCRVCDVELEEGHVKIEDLNLIFKSRDLVKHLTKCKQVAIFVASLGLNVDQMIHKLEFSQMSDAFILNAVAVEYMEKYCDYIQLSVKETLQDERFITSRFSCGYGDFDLTYQNEIIHKLNATKLVGVQVLDNHLMIPSKSVSAIFGIADEYVSSNMKKCEDCLDNGKCSGKCYLKEE